MSKYLEYYQFHEKDEDGNIVCLYCIVKKTDDGICLQFEKDYNTALKELEEFAYDMAIKLMKLIILMKRLELV